MPHETVELHGHIIDSLLLPKVLDEVTARGGTFVLEALDVGRLRTEPSYARLVVEHSDADSLEAILVRIQEHGATLIHEVDAQTQPAPALGVFPDGFYVTSNHPTEVRRNGEWHPVGPVRMDCGIVIEAGRARTARFAEIREGEAVVVGHQGVRVLPVQRDVRQNRAFEFMRSEVSSEKPRGAAIRAVAQALLDTRAAGKEVLLVAGPALVHTGAATHTIRLIEMGLVQRIFSGNALAVHDIEQAFYGTALGINLQHGMPVDAGHQHHIHAINRIRRVGGIRQAVEAGLLTSGLMYACVRHGIDVLLAGSVRDDGPLPEVITDVVTAQLEMAARVGNVGFALMIASLLHSVATGNMLPADCRIAIVDINPAVVTKLVDRGSFQAVGIVTDVEPFLHELTAVLAELRGAP